MYSVAQLHHERLAGDRAVSGLGLGTFATIFSNRLHIDMKRHL